MKIPAGILCLIACAGLLFWWNVVRIAVQGCNQVLQGTGASACTDSSGVWLALGIAAGVAGMLFILAPVRSRW